MRYLHPNPVSQQQKAMKRTGTMKFFPCLILICLVANTPVSAQIKNETLDLRKIASAFHFPASELTQRIIANEERKANGEAVISAWEIKSRTPFAFFPVLITIAHEGTFVRAKTREVLASYDKLPVGLVTAGGRGPFGTLSMGEDLFGGVLGGHIDVAATSQPFDVPRVRMATFSAVNIKSKHVDVRIAVLAPFSGGEELVKVPGGEGYYMALSETDDDAGSTAVAAGEALNAKVMFTELNEIVAKSPVITSVGKGSTADSVGDNKEAHTGSQTLATMESADMQAGEPASGVVKHSLPIWIWVAVIAALALFGLLAWVKIRRGQ